MTEDIKKIQNHLKDSDLDAMVVFTNDDHGSEYVVDHYKFRAFLSGFTGSAGTLVITKDQSFLWTDGRYFLQAEQQLAVTGTKLMKMNEPGYPSVFEFLAKFQKIELDFQIVTVAFMSQLQRIAPHLLIVDNRTIMDQIWKNRPPMVNSQVSILSKQQVGESTRSKLKNLREDLAKENCGYALISALDDIAWLYNIRGNDISYNPVNYAFSLIGNEEAILYIEKEKINPQVQVYLSDQGVTVKEYEEIYQDVQKVDEKILLDSTKTNYALYILAKDKKETAIFPTTKRKAIKNSTEIKNLKRAHLADAVAMVRFIRYLKKYVGKEKMDELSVAEKLKSFRFENKACTDLSFETICGYAAHGAIVHYSATPETNSEILKSGFLLVDSGAQYTFGTTDITRTIALGKVSAEMKRDYTTVLKSHIALATAIFPEGTTGYALDMLARQPLYKQYKDYRHGTGHGVGYILNVHEGPQRINIRSLDHESTYPICPGMITSDEPGLYIDGKYGIRHENLVLCVKKKGTEYGNFCGFQPLTLVPFDLDAVDVKLLTEEEKKWLNEYHKSVYRQIAGYLNKSEQQFLKKATREI